MPREGLCRWPVEQESEEQLKTLQNEQAQFVNQYQELTRLQAAVLGRDEAGTGPTESRKRQETMRARVTHLEHVLSEGAPCRRRGPVAVRTA